MKLISCYIENFGNLNMRTFDFGSGLTAYCEDNGYGKTTLAAFLRAMFYGLPTSRLKAKEDDRLRYYPFNGGKFGGNLTFESDGDIYKIVRFFDKKSATEDSFSLYKNDKLVSASEEAGKQFFGIDEQSFLNTVFITSADADAQTTDDISAKLKNIVDGTDEKNDYSSAMDILTAAQKTYKGRGGSGCIAETKQRIIQIKNDIKNKEVICGGLGVKYSSREDLCARIAAAEAKQKQANESGLVMQRWETYESYAADAAKVMGQAQEIASHYPAGMPTPEEAQTLTRSYAAKKLTEEKLSVAGFAPAKAQRLETLNTKFAEGGLNEEVLSDANKKLADTIRLQAENDSAGLAQGGQITFKYGVPDSEEAQALAEKLKKQRTTVAAAPNKKAGKLPLIIGIIAGIVMLAGIGVAFAVVAAGIALIAAGVVGVVAAAFVYFKQQLNNVSPQQDNTAAAEAAGYLARYGYGTDDGVEVGLNNLLRDVQQYKARQEAEGKALARQQERGEQCAALQSELIALLERYGIQSGNIQAGLTQLGGEWTEYKNLQSESEQTAQQTAALQSALEENGGIINTILNKYALAPDCDISRVCAEVEDYRKLIESAGKCEKRASDYKAVNNLSARPDSAPDDPEEIARELSALRPRLAQLDREIGEDEDAAERLEELRAELESENEKLQLYTKKYNYLVQAAEFLKMAEGNLKERYIAPVREKFLNYSVALEKTLGEKVTMDENFGVYFERGGERRSDRHLSSGQKSLCNLCIRLALIDNMYKDRQPFIIMDDPFAYLDESHIKKAAILLKELARDRQIIYFCCHPSRSLKN